jgi:putative Holliday junction resolvase
MNYLGIDYGEKRIGLAKAMGETRIATPFTTISNNEGVFEMIGRIINVENIDIVVIGIPVSFDGSENDFARSVRKFGEKIESVTGKRIEFENEIFSSKIASEYSDDIDKSSAAIILQGFFNRTKI